MIIALGPERGVPGPAREPFTPITQSGVGVGVVLGSRAILAHSRAEDVGAGLRDCW